MAQSRGALIAIAVQDRLDERLLSEVLGETEILDVSDWRLTRDYTKMDEFFRAVAGIVGRKPLWEPHAQAQPFRARALTITGDRRPGHDVFISYKSDDRSAVKPFVEIFQNFGFSVWWDQMIQAGANWGFAIDTALVQSRCVVVFWTPSAVTSQEVYTEAEHGMSKNSYFPILLQRCEIPPRMTRAQYVDLTRGAAIEAESFHRLIDQIKKKVEEAAR